MIEMENRLVGGCQGSSMVEESMIINGQQEGSLGEKSFCILASSMTIS